MQPGRFTELFFLDEATAIAAGHRACALCRRDDYRRLQAIWRRIHPGPAMADTIDARLHRERVDPDTGGHRLHEAAFGSLPDGAFVLLNGAPHVLAGRHALRWTPAGYVDPRPRPVRGRADLVTPPSLVDVLRAGWDPLVPFLHPSADGGADPAARPRARDRARPAPR
jgi:hypothetical protein